MAKPFVKWAGGKTQLLSIIDENLPDFNNINTYIEPFVGGGAVLFHLLDNESFRNNISYIYINDKNKELASCYYAIKHDIEKLIKILTPLRDKFLMLAEPERKQYYNTIREKYNEIIHQDKYSVESVAYFIFLNKTCFNGLYRVNANGNFNVPIGAYKHPTIFDKDNLYEVSKCLQAKNVQIFMTDFSDLKSFITDTTFVYIDPPYRPLNKTSNFTTYTPNAFTDEQQEQLKEFCDCIDLRGGKFLLSNSDPHNVDITDNFFDDLYDIYNIERIQAKRAINSNGKKRGNITELLIKNY